MVDIGAGELFVRIGDGDGPPVLALHGWMATADVNFFPLYRTLADHRLVAVDHRGHGRSFVADHVTMEAMADDAAALLDRLDLGAAVVVGYSMGTAVAQHLAARRPDLVRALVLSGGALHWRRPWHRPMLWRAGWDGALQRLSTGRFFARRLGERAARTSQLAREVAPWIVGEIERGHPGNLRDAGRSLARFDARRLLGTAAGVPTTVLVTAGDHLVPARRQRALADALGARVVEIDGDHDSPAAHAEVWGAAVADEVCRLVA